MVAADGQWLGPALGEQRLAVSVFATHAASSSSRPARTLKEELERERISDEPD